MLPKFGIVALFWNRSASKSKIRLNFEIFDRAVPVKITGGVDEMHDSERSLIIATQG